MDVQITPDSTRVIYSIKFDDTLPVILYSAPISGGIGDELTPMIWDRSGVSQFKISPDSAYAVYTADKLNNNAVELYSVTISGAANVRINPAFASGRSIRSFEITPTTLSGVYGVVYMADQETANKDGALRRPDNRRRRVRQI